MTSTPLDTPKGLRRGYLLWPFDAFSGSDPSRGVRGWAEPIPLRQGGFHSAKAAFGHHYPNYDPRALAEAVCDMKGWRCQQVRFYTGVSDASDNPFWNHFWVAKGAQMGREGVRVFTRSLR